jgi:hypothetical protein
MFRRAAGRPLLPRMDLAAQQRQTMSRCQRRMVSGVIRGRDQASATEGDSAVLSGSLSVADGLSEACP